jgi:hypothetical protein
VRLDTSPDPPAEVVAVHEQAGGRGDQPEEQEDVEQCDPAHREVQPVDGHEQPRRAAEQRGPEQPSAEPAEHQHGERAEDGGHDPPAERLLAAGQLLDVGRVEPVAEQHLAEAEHPLADRRVDDEPALHAVGVELHPVLPDVVGVVPVVQLVERLLARDVQPVQPQPEGHERHEQAGDPAAHPVGRHGRQQPAADGVEVVRGST